MTTWTVGASADDIENAVITEATPDIAYNGEKKNTAYRFTNVTIPKGSTINTATFTLICRTTRTANPSNVTVACEAVDDAAAFDNLVHTAAASIAARTIATVSWDITGTWWAGTGYSPGDIKACVKEVTDRAGWISGNDLVVNIEGTASGDYKPIHHYDSDSGKTATLAITWTPPAGGLKYLTQLGVGW